MYDMATFDVSDKVRCTAALRAVADGAESEREVAERIVRHLYENLTEAGGGPACALVRLYRTYAYGELDDERRAFAAEVLGGEEPAAEIKCLTLLATAGQEPRWNSTHDSVGHKAIPLPSEEVVRASPMISQLILQLGLDVPTILRPDPAIVGNLAEKEFNIFYVPVARSSRYIPAQEEFVVPYKIKSALGFGGLLPSGDLFAVVLFSKVYIRPEAAKTFRTLALTVKSALLGPAVGRA